MNQRPDKFSSIGFAIQRRILPATVTFISVIVGSVFYLIITPRQYQGITKLILDESRTQILNSHRETNLTNNYNQISKQYNPLTEQVEIIKSKQVLAGAIALLKDDYPESELPTIANLRSRLEVRSVPHTKILELRYHNSDPELAAATVSAIAKATIEQSERENRRQARSLREVLEAEAIAQQHKLNSIELSENQYRAKNGLIAFEPQTDNPTEAIKSLEARESRLQAQIQEQRRRVQNLQTTLQVDRNQNSNLGGKVGQNLELEELRRQLVTLETKLAQSRSYLTEQNPMLIHLREERDRVAQLYHQKLSRSIASSDDFPLENLRVGGVLQDPLSQSIDIKNQLTSLEVRLLSVTEEKQKLKQYLSILPNQIQHLNHLIRQKKAAQNSLKFIQRKLEEARLIEIQTVSELKIIQPAEIPDAPSFPNPAKTMAIALLAATFLSLSLVLVLESLDNTLNNIEEVEQKLELPLLGTSPSLPPAALSLENAHHFLYDFSLVEPYRVFLKNIESRVRGQLKILTIGSTIPGEGKSVVASHLAAVSAMLSRRTLLIDADLRHPKQHDLFNTQFKPGLSDVVADYVELADAVKQTNTKNLFLLPCGQLAGLPSTILDSVKMPIILHQAAQKYDLIIIDTPSVSSCADAHTLSQHSDGLVMVTHPKVTPKDVLLRVVSELKRNHIPLLGFALNGTTAETDRYYRYNYDRDRSLYQQMFLPPASNHQEQQERPEKFLF